MPIFKYSAINTKNGIKTNAKIDVNNKQQAVDYIKKQGLTPIEIKEQFSINGIKLSSSKVQQKDIILFTRQLSTLLNAGLPLVQALRSTADQIAAKGLKQVIDKCIAEIETGKSLSQALTEYPKVFSVIYINLIAAGETSGTLDKSLERLAFQLEKDSDTTKKIRSAFIYPVIVLFVMILVMGFMVIKVLPAVGNIYSGLKGAHLPFLTVWLLDLSHFIIKFWWLVILIVTGLVLFFNYSRGTSSGRSILDRLKMKTWPIGKLFMKIYMSRFSRTACTLITSGVPLIQALEITSKSVNNVHIAKTLEDATKKIKLGKSLSESLDGSESFLPLVPSMIKIGETSGTIEQMLDRLAIYYENEVDNEVKAISTLIEPILMIILGVFALIIVAAVLLPIYSLAGNSNFTSGNGTL